MTSDQYLKAIEDLLLDLQEHGDCTRFARGVEYVLRAWRAQ